MKRYFKCLVAAAVLTTGRPSQATLSAQQSADSVVIAGPLGSRMNDYMTRAEALGFSGQVLAARDGHVLLHRAFGLSDRRGQLPMRTSTAIGVASMSKQFAAAAILKLEAEGRLHLTDTLGQYFSAVPADKRSITIQQLLVHTGGIQGGTSDDFDVASLDQSMARLFSLPLTGVPGKEWQYSSDAYGIVAAIIQRVSGMPYEQYMRDFLFRPAGMTHTGFWSEARSMPDVAHAYAGLRDRGSPREWPRDWRVFGSGDVLSTAADLYKWDRSLRTGKILSPAALVKYLSPQVSTGTGTDMYGYGLFIEKSARGTRIVEHGGDTEVGFNGAFFRYVDENAVLIVTSNARDPFGRSLRQYVQGDLDKMLFGNDSVSQLPNAERIPLERQASMAGSYAIGTGSELHLITDGQNMWIAADGQDAVNLLRPATPAAASSSTLTFVNARMDTLAQQLLNRDSLAYVHALGDSGVAHIDDYRDEWKALVQKFGPLNRYRVMGAVFDRNSVVSYVLLSFARFDLPMTFRWSRSGMGRLASTNAESAPPYPVLLPIAQIDGKFVAYDFWRAQARARIEVQDGMLRISRLENGTELGGAVTSKVMSRTGWSSK